MPVVRTTLLRMENFLDQQRSGEESVVLYDSPNFVLRANDELVVWSPLHIVIRRRL